MDYGSSEAGALKAACRAGRIDVNACFCVADIDRGCYGKKNDQKSQIEESLVS